MAPPNAAGLAINTNVPPPHQGPFKQQRRATHSTANTGNPQDDWRNLILAFDGTANFFDDNVSNVARLIRYLKKDDFRHQMFYYQPGIGTYVDPTTMRANTLRNVSKAVDLAVAWFLDGHIMEGYKYIMQNYRQGDRISLFGFSRGAYIARCLAGMIHKVGLLPKDNHEQIQFAWECYTDTSAKGEERAAEFKRTFCADIRIDFMGVWDTVSSVGVFLSRHFPFTSSNVGVRCFRQALALDEHRARFNPNIWHRPSPDAAGAANDPEHSTKPNANVLSRMVRVIQDPDGRITVPVGDSVDDSGREPANVKMWPETDIKEVWFPGVHADVGGGSVHIGVKHSLANNSLRWMIKEILEQTTIQLDEEGLKEIGIMHIIRSQTQPKASTGILSAKSVDGAPVDSSVFVDNLVESPVEETPERPLPYKYRMVRAMKAHPDNAQGHQGITAIQLVDDEDYEYRRVVKLVVSKEQLIADATAPMHDQLKKSKLWWMMEFFPMYLSYQDKEGNWHKKWGFNMGDSRSIRLPDPIFHSSVRLRIEATAEMAKSAEKKKQKWWRRKPAAATPKGYMPAAKYAGTIKYVD